MTENKAENPKQFTSSPNGAVTHIPAVSHVRAYCVNKNVIRLLYGKKSNCSTTKRSKVGVSNRTATFFYYNVLLKDSKVSTSNLFPFLITSPRCHFYSTVGFW